MFGWAKAINNGAAIIVHVNDGSNNQYYYPAIRSTDKGAIVARNITFLSAAGTTVVTSGWFSFCTTFISDTSKKIFIKGLEEAELTTSVTYTTTINAHSIGYIARTSAAGFLSGEDGFRAVWNVQLKADEIAS